MNSLFSEESEGKRATGQKSVALRIAFFLSIPVFVLACMVLYMILMMIFPSIAPY